jgi:peptidoglycan/xylan/chitin deacetylase (PgdA/CDA1 family)
MRRRAKNIIAHKNRYFKWMLIIAILGVPITHERILVAKTNQPGVIYWHGDLSEHKVALTFDDGPNEPYTSQILSVLKDYNVHATFFMMGENVKLYPDSARAIVRAGHAIGNHSYSHRDLVLETNSGVRQEISRTDDMIYQTTGQKPNLFRPPYGNENFLTRRQSTRTGHVMVEWNVSAQDWTKPGANQIVASVMQQVHNGSIILLHDGNKWHHGSDRSQTVAALPQLITQLRLQGYELVTVPEILKINDLN